MGFLDWLFRRRPRLVAERRRPKIIAEFGDDSPLVFVKMDELKAVTVMDREMFDYLCGETGLSAPAQRDLDELLPRVTRIAHSPVACSADRRWVPRSFSIRRRPKP